MNPLPISPVWETVVILFFVTVSGVYTAAETALLALMRAHRRMLEEDEMADESNTFEKEVTPALGPLLDRPGVLSATFMLGRMTARVLAATVTALLAYRLALTLETGDPRWSLLLGVLVTVMLLLLLAEVLPRVCAARWPEGTLNLSVPLVRFTALLFTPITALLTQVLRRFGRGDAQHSFLTAEELRELLEERQDSGQLEDVDREMIEDLLEFGETMVKSVMVPRIDIVGIPMDAEDESILQTVRETGHSRLPVYSGDVDHVVGIIHAKDLFKQHGTERFDVARLSRKAMFVPETKMIDDLLREFQRTRSHMAIVVDEYGGTAGLVTLEDLLEEIVGEIQDEYDSETPPVERLGPDAWMVDAALDLEDFEEETGIQLPKDGYDTLGGFLYSVEGELPEKGHELNWENIRFVIRETRDRRILKVEVTRLPGPAAESS